MTNNGNTQLIQGVDKEMIRTLASLSFEKQTFVKGIILGLCNQPFLSTPQSSSRQASQGSV